MNIILVSPLPPPAGGIASWTQQYLNSKETKENVVAVVNSSVIGERIYQLTNRRLKDELLRVIRIRKEINRLLNSGEYDVIHYNLSCSMLGMIKDYICLRQAKGKINIIVHYHCDTEYMVQGYASEFIFQNICKLADLIFCLNTSSRRHIKRVAKKDSIIVPNFIVPQYNNYERIISNEIRTVIFVGHVIPSKGYFELLKVAEKYPGIAFKLIGACSDEYRNVKYPNVEFTGEKNKEQVIQELNSADLLLFPSHTEGFPMVVLEAMSCGLPIVATNVGAIPDMIEDKGGKLVNVGDVDGMVKAIAELKYRETRINISKWNINKVLNSYIVDTVMKKIFEIYGEKIL